MVPHIFRLAVMLPEHGLAHVGATITLLIDTGGLVSENDDT